MRGTEILHFLYKQEWKNNQKCLRNAWLYNRIAALLVFLMKANGLSELILRVGHFEYPRHFE